MIKTQQIIGLARFIGDSSANPHFYAEVRFNKVLGYKTLLL